MAHLSGDEPILDAVTRGADPKRSRADCPRCGYDQRGVIESWRDACPLVGTCTECGLEFSWSEVLEPDKHEPRWCVEYAPRRRLLPPPVRRTIFRSALPWWFWSSLKMSHDIRWRRIVVYLVMLSLVLLTCLAIQQGAVGYGVRRDMALRVQNEKAQMASVQAALTTQLKHLGEYKTIAERGDGWEALQEKHFRRELRDEDLAQIIKSQEAYIAQLQGWLNGTYALSHSYTDAILEPILTPFSSWSNGSMTTPFTGAIAYPAPSMLHVELFIAQTNSWMRNEQLIERAVVALYGLGAGATLFILLPPGFILLPATRRKAKVRWAHIARVAAYGAVIPTAIFSSLALAVAVAAVFEDAREGVLNWALRLATLVPAPLLVIWWAVAIRRYLRIPHALSLTLMLSAMNLLIVVAILWFIEPRSALFVYEHFLEWLDPLLQ